jgi:cystathionine beta-lyase family protein involved in aluminum resistance
MQLEKAINALEEKKDRLMAQKRAWNKELQYTTNDHLEEQIQQYQTAINILKNLHQKDIIFNVLNKYAEFVETHEGESGNVIWYYYFDEINQNIIQNLSHNNNL